MKNKKLFGKLNIIDILILLILIAALVFVGVRLFGGNDGGTATKLPTSEPNLRFTVLCAQLPREHRHLTPHLQQQLASRRRDRLLGYH